MADILQIAKESREALAAEVARLDEFIWMAEALEQNSQSQIPALCGPTPEPALPEKGPAAVTGDVVREASRQADTNIDKQAAVDAPRLLLPYYADEADRDRGVKRALIRRPVRPPHSVSTFAAYLEVLRERVRQHFEASHSVPALVEAKWIQRLLAFGKTALAACRSRGTERLSIGRQAAFVAALLEGIGRHSGNAPTAPALASPSAKVLLPGLTDNDAPASLLRHPARAMCSPSAHSEPSRTLASGTTHREHGVSPERQVGSMARIAGALDQLRTPEKSAARSLDLHLGQKLRQRRWMLGMSRQRLAQRIGVTRAQIEKYESGAEQIDVTRLYNIAAVLEVPTAFFFEGLDVQATDDTDSRAALLSDEEALQQFGELSSDSFVFLSSRSA